MNKALNRSTKDKTCTFPEGLRLKQPEYGSKKDLLILTTQILITLSTCYTGDTTVNKSCIVCLCPQRAYNSTGETSAKGRELQGAMGAFKRRIKLRLAAAAAKSLQSCLTVCDPIDSSPPGSPVPRILQARTLENSGLGDCKRFSRS